MASCVLPPGSSLESCCGGHQAQEPPTSSASLRVETDKCGAGKEQEMWDEHKVGEMLSSKLHSR